MSALYHEHESWNQIRSKKINFKITVIWNEIKSSKSLLVNKRIRKTDNIINRECLLESIIINLKDASSMNYWLINYSR